MWNSYQGWYAAVPFFQFLYHVLRCICIKNTRVNICSTFSYKKMRNDTKFYLQVSLGTLLAYTTVAISVLILRYVPPVEVPLPLSFHEAIDSVSSQHSMSYGPGHVSIGKKEVYSINPENTPLLVKKPPVGYHLINGGWNCKFL